ncbi:Rv0361 family membrane protein [Agromyces atrinae]|uniref:DUF4878 domain-containing protein n=1 Tax=Agromyces atrinae TaxID=592376 RepID=A0A4Q2M8T2_9MICO|nr:DUF4878 domain-containing protein [Agromyces atrinae]NYD65692.1 hypothetical protein [Agromyces atrinae]RXZ85490.1 DUF4878 domain-containing protein [Agromyces atrinae]
MSFPKRMIAAAALGGAVLLLAACASPQSSTDTSDDPTQTVTEFLQSVQDGEYASALKLSTSSPADVACEPLAQNDQEGGGVNALKVADVTVSGDTATAEVSYYSGGEISESLELTRADGSWRVVLPESYRIALAFDAPVVAEADVNDGLCSVAVVDGAVDMVAWPGNYRIGITDPTGVLERFDEFLYAVPSGEVVGTVDPLALEAVPEVSLNDVASRADPLLGAAMAACIDSAFTGPTCPAGVIGADAPTGDAADLVTGQYSWIDRVWTDDGETWRFETRPGSISITTGGTPSVVEFTTTGTLSTDTNGDLVVDVDQS